MNTCIHVRINTHIQIQTHACKCACIQHYLQTCSCKSSEAVGSSEIAVYACSYICIVRAMPSRLTQKHATSQISMDSSESSHHLLAMSKAELLPVLAAAPLLPATAAPPLSLAVAPAPQPYALLVQRRLHPARCEKCCGIRGLHVLMRQQATNNAAHLQ